MPIEIHTVPLGIYIPTLGFLLAMALLIVSINVDIKGAKKQNLSKIEAQRRQGKIMSFTMVSMLFIILSSIFLPPLASGGFLAVKDANVWTTDYIEVSEEQLLQDYYGLTAQEEPRFYSNREGELFKDCYINVDWDKEEIKRVLCASGAEAKAMPAVKQ